MPPLSAIPGLPPEAEGYLVSCGIDSAEMLATIPPEEIHRVLELTAWQKGKLHRAPSLAAITHWAELARAGPGPDVILPATSLNRNSPTPFAPPSADHDDIPEAIVMPRTSLPEKNAYLSPIIRARQEVSGPPSPLSPPPPLEVEPARILPTTRKNLDPAPPTAPVPPAEVRFNTFDAYQSGQSKVAPLNRRSLDLAADPAEFPSIERFNFPGDLPRTVRRGVVHPNPFLLVSGAIISLLWRIALVSAIVAVPWLVVAVDRPSQYGPQILAAAGVLTAFGIAQLVIISKLRCRICTCHLFHSRRTVKNRKAHSLPLLGKTASLSLHLLLFQWFRCMYCGTAIKLWTSKSDQAVREE